MVRALKNTFKNLLGSKNYLINYQFPDRPSGYSLEYDLTTLIRKKDPVCFDVGANVGQTITSFKKTFANPLIFAFEPATQTYQSLVQRFGNDSRVKLFGMALGEAESKRELVNFKASELNSFLKPAAGTSYFQEDIQISRTEIVDISTVDTIMKKHQLSEIDILKIDTQGFEMSVLKGAIEALRNHKVKSLVLEMNFKKVYESQSSPAEIIAYLDSLGYGIVDLYNHFRHQGRIAWCDAVFAL